MGGPSSERDVSIQSGTAIAEALSTAGYGVETLVLTDETLPEFEAEAVFVAIHGAFGEDGGVQHLLEERGLPYIGTRAGDMPVSFNKVTTRETLQAAGLPIAEGEVLAAGVETSRISCPCVVKPPQQGSSIGITVVNEPDAFAHALTHAREFEDDILVETFIPGRELTVGILGDTVLPVVEICPAEGVYDYDAKYTYNRGKTEYKVPAPIPDAVTAEAQRLAKAAFDALGGRHLGRIDFRLNEADELFILELNTIPGFTSNSLLPKAAACAGIPFPELCAAIMEMAE